MATAHFNKNFPNLKSNDKNSISLYTEIRQEQIQYSQTINSQKSLSDTDEILYVSLSHTAVRTEILIFSQFLDSKREKLTYAENS